MKGELKVACIDILLLLSFFSRILFIFIEVIIVAMLKRKADVFNTIHS
jgi:hypothetical protein